MKIVFEGHLSDIAVEMGAMIISLKSVIQQNPDENATRYESEQTSPTVTAAEAKLEKKKAAAAKKKATAAAKKAAAEEEDESPSDITPDMLKDKMQELMSEGIMRGPDMKAFLVAETSNNASRMSQIEEADIPDLYAKLEKKLMDAGA